MTVLPRHGPKAQQTLGRSRGGYRALGKFVFVSCLGLLRVRASLFKQISGPLLRFQRCLSYDGDYELCFCRIYRERKDASGVKCIQTLAVGGPAAAMLHGLGLCEPAQYAFASAKVLFGQI